jgi:Galactose oxidase, central domain/Kelch motif
MNINTIHSLTLAMMTLAVSLSLSQPAQATGWANTGSLNTAREDHTATLLPDGKVLVSGGANNNSGVYVFPASTELYDPASGIWTTTSSLNTPRGDHTATYLPSGKVLVAGGQYWNGSAYICLSSAELYDPTGRTWTTTGSLNAARYSHTATLLSNGKVLVAAGWNGPDNDATNSAEIYDPASGTWTVTGSLNAARYLHTATLLTNGQVLVAGGAGDLDTGYSTLSSAELFNPTNDTWTPTGSLNTERQYHTATLLPNSKVLVVGAWTTMATPWQALNCMIQPARLGRRPARSTPNASTTRRRCCPMARSWLWGVWTPVAIPQAAPNFTIRPAALGVWPTRWLTSDLVLTRRRC